MRRFRNDWIYSVGLSLWTVVLTLTLMIRGTGERSAPFRSF
jgi:hypothetical protein